MLKNFDFQKYADETLQSLEDLEKGVAVFRAAVEARVKEFLKKDSSKKKLGKSMPSKAVVPELYDTAYRNSESLDHYQEGLSKGEMRDVALPLAKESATPLTDNASKRGRGMKSRTMDGFLPPRKG